MKTPEKYEAEVFAMITLIDGQLQKLSGSLSEFDEIAGENPAYVYGVLKSSFEKTVADYDTMINRGPESMDAILARLDKIENVIEDALLQLRIKSEEEQTMTTPSQGILDQANQAAESAAEGLAQLAEGVVGSSAVDAAPSGLFKNAVIGGGAFLLTKVAGFGNILALGAAIGATMLLNAKK